MTGGWTDGYLAEIEYRATLHRELAPTNLALAAAIKLVDAPPPGRPYTYLEMGCGHGVTTATLAAANPHATFYGNDFNPAHIVHARRLAADAGIDNVTFLEQSFAELRETDLPAFDYIALHGILSWISADNVDHIVALIGRRLKPGGIAYVSYNALPGWAAVAPLQRLLETFSRQFSGSVLDRLGQSIVLTEQLKDAEATYFSSNPLARLWVENFRTADPQYLAHEYLNEHWTPYYGVDVHARMSAAKLTYVASADQIENFQDDSMAPALRRLLNDIPAGPLRELAYDFAVNRTFRRDVFARGVIPIDVAEQRRRLMDMRFVLTRSRGRCEVEARVPNGTVRLDDPIFPAIFDIMAAGPLTLGALCARPALASFGREAVVRAMMVLLSVGYADPALPAADDAVRRARTDRFNEVAVRRMLDGKAPRSLVSPVLGNGLQLDPIDCYCLAAIRDGRDPVDFMLDRISANGQPVAKDGKNITDPSVLRAELAVRARATADDGPPFLATLGIEI